MNFKKVICYVLGHEYAVEKQLNLSARKLTCKRCNAKFAMHDTTKSVVAWNDEIEQMYAPCGVLHNLDGEMK